jgi:hypothetical protein
VLCARGGKWKGFWLHLGRPFLIGPPRGPAEFIDIYADVDSTHRHRWKTAGGKRCICIVSYQTIHGISFSVWQLYRDIRLQLQLNFSSVRPSFPLLLTPQECNNVAHCLAAYSVSRQCSRSIWSETLPDDVKDMVASVSAEPSK